MRTLLVVVAIGVGCVGVANLPLLTSRGRDFYARHEDAAILLHIANLLTCFLGWTGTGALGYHLTNSLWGFLAGLFVGLAIGATGAVLTEELI